MTAPKEGIYYDIPFAEYAAWPYLSKSALSTFATSPALWYGRHTGMIPRKTSAAYQLGSLVDLLWVEQRDIVPANGYEVMPGINPMTDKPMPGSGKVRQAYIDTRAADGVEVVSRATADKAVAMADALDRNGRATALRDGATPQVSLVWRHPATGLMLKGRPDLPNLDDIVLPDLKTSRHLGHRLYSRDFSDYNYHWQLHMYAQGLAANGAGSYDDWAHNSWHIIVDNAQPHGVACRPIDRAAFDVAAHEVDAQIAHWLQCHNDNDWPADDLDERVIELPRWRG